MRVRACVSIVPRLRTKLSLVVMLDCRKKITYLAPSAGELPSRILILGTLAWLET